MFSRQQTNQEQVTVVSLVEIRTDIGFLEVTGAFGVRDD